MNGFFGGFLGAVSNRQRTTAFGVHRRGTGMSMVCGALLGHGRGMDAVCRDWTGQAKIFQGRFLLDETAKIEWLGMDGGVGCQPDSSSGRGTQEQ